MGRVFSADQLAVIRAVVSTSSTRVSKTLRCGKAEVQSLLDGLHSLYEPDRQRGPLRSAMYALSFVPALGTPTATLAAPIISTYCSTNQRIICVNSRLGIIRADAGGEASVTHKACQDRTEANGSFEVLVHGMQYFHYLRGRLINEGNFQEPDRIIPPGPNWSRSFADLRGLIDDHMENKVDGERGFRYWHDKDKRILLSVPDGTEQIFHLSLFEWLNMYVADRLTITAEPTGMGQNKTDIVVTTAAGGNIIEIKWLGENDKKTICRAEHISFGLEQVKKYLDRDKSMISGNVIVYDGRTEAQHSSDKGWKAEHKHHLCSDPLIRFLPSESTSSAAKKVVRKAKRK